MTQYIEEQSAGSYRGDEAEKRMKKEKEKNSERRGETMRANDEETGRGVFETRAAQRSMGESTATTPILAYDMRGHDEVVIVGVLVPSACLRGAVRASIQPEPPRSVRLHPGVVVLVRAAPLLGNHRRMRLQRAHRNLRRFLGRDHRRMEVCREEGVRLVVVHA